MANKPEQQMPPRGDDPFSSFLREAASNERVSLLKLPAVYSLLRQVHSTFDCVAAAIEKDDKEELLLPRILLGRAHSAFLAAARLSMSGQAFEATPENCRTTGGTQSRKLDGPART